MSASFTSTVHRIHAKQLRDAHTMRYRFPLELELTILELAAPALAIDSLHDRVDFFINISLVHRSFTTWAQERLHDQFLYTYQPRPDEHARLKTRLEAAVGGDCPLRRLYLDLTALPANILKRREPGADSVSATMYGRVYPAVSDPQQAGTDADEQPCISVAHFRQSQHDPDDGYWELCAMISSYSQTIDTLWIKPPFLDLNIKDLSRASASVRSWRISESLTQTNASSPQRLAYFTSTTARLTVPGAISGRSPPQARQCCSCGTPVSAWKKTMEISTYAT